MIRKVFFILFFSITTLLTGCTIKPPVIDLSESVFKVAPVSQSERIQIGTISIINKADEGKPESGFLTNRIIPVIPATTTKETVEQDLKNFFADTISIDKSAPQDLTVTISRADVYYVVGVASQFPFLGFALVDIDRDFCLNLRVLFEIEKKGKVTAQYQFDELITIQGTSPTQGARIESYQELIAEYRKQFFSEIETRFLARYF